jgi:hypothetical protein
MDKCKDCGKEVGKSARRCPHCGAYHWSTGRIVFASIFALLVLLFVVGVIVGSRVGG